MIVAAGADHAGFELKQQMVQWIREQGHEVLDLGTHDRQECDYPDCAVAVAESLLQNCAERGVLICGSGVGVSVAANKIPGIRAAICHDVYSARQGVEHDNMNVIVLGSMVVGQALARECIRAFLDGVFSEQERYARRLAKVEALEIAQRQSTLDL